MPKLKNPKPPREKTEILISIKEFADRTGRSYASATHLAKSKFFRDNKISVKTTPAHQKGGIKIDWQKYLKFLDENPVVPTSKQVSKSEKAFAG